MGFLDKRDKEGKLLGFSIYPLQYYISEICFENFKKSSVYKILSENLNKPLIDIYFKKIFYESSLRLACQILLSENCSTESKKIESSFPFLRYIESDIRFKLYVDSLHTTVYRFKRNITIITIDHSSGRPQFLDTVQYFATCS